MAIIGSDLFSLQLDRADERDVIRVVGELDVATAPLLRQELNRLVEDGEHDVVIDLARMSFIDSTGLSVLLGGLRRLRDQQRDLTLTNPTRSTLRVFEIVGFTAVFTIVTEPVEPAEGAGA